MNSKLFTILTCAIATLWATQHTEPLRIYLEANIGAGKTSILQVLKKHGYTVSFEPVDTWIETGALGGLYNNPEKYGFPFRIFALNTVTHQTLNTPKANVIIFERSIYSDRQCFTENAFRKNHFDVIQKNIYLKTYELCEQLLPKPDGFIFVQTDPDICIDRIKSRDRSDEVNLPVDLIYNLDTLHKEWFFNKNLFTEKIRDVPHVTVSGNKHFSPETLEQDIEQELLPQIELFITKLQKQEALQASS